MYLNRSISIFFLAFSLINFTAKAQSPEGKNPVISFRNHSELGAGRSFSGDRESNSRKTETPVGRKGYALGSGESNQYNPENLKLRYKIIPLTDPVYRLIDYFEVKGETGFMPMAKPYTKEYIVRLLLKLKTSGNLSGWEKDRVDEYLDDAFVITTGLPIYKGETENTFALIGFSADASVRSGFGDNGTWATSLIGEPYLSGDLGTHLTFTGALGLAIERLTPDIFYQSYTKDGQVHFPNESIGYSYLPYQFNFESMWAHVLTAANSGEGAPVKNDLTAGMIYHTELNGSWWNGAVQLSINNQRRAIGHDESNLVLSSFARRFPGIELRIQPAKWIRYSYLTGSLFSYANQKSTYKKYIYGHDIGQVQKNLTFHLIEFMPTKWLQFSGGGGNIWSKRLELAYLVPFVYPQFTQIDVGDHDNLSLYFDLATQFQGFGKTWLGFYVDEFSFIKKGKLLKMPRNRYAWQLGWKTNLLSEIIPGTTSTLKYTRVTPFVYTHYPDSTFNTFGSRPNDMTYTHDEFNLGFYLPPNSGEFNWKLVNVAIPDLVLSLENRLIIHGTNDLAGTNIYQIYGDVYRDQVGDVEAYPLMNFTKDGIYDWTAESEFKFDWKIRKSGGTLKYYRLVGSLGYGKTWWRSNDSGVETPAGRTLFTGSLGIVVGM